MKCDVTWEINICGFCHKWTTQQLYLTPDMATVQGGCEACWLRCCTCEVVMLWSRLAGVG